MKPGKRRDAPYRVYVRALEGTPDSSILLWTETLTGDPTLADAAIQDLLGNDSLQDKAFVLIAQYRGSVYFTHEFAPLDDGGQVVPSLLARLGRIDWLRYPSIH